MGGMDWILAQFYILTATNKWEKWSGRCEERERIWKGRETKVLTFFIKHHCNSSSMDLFYLLLVYMIMLAIVQIIQHQMIEWLLNAKGCGRKWPWPNFRYSAWRDWRKSQKPVNISEIWTRYLLNTEQKCYPLDHNIWCLSSNNTAMCVCVCIVLCIYNIYKVSLSKK